MSKALLKAAAAGQVAKLEALLDEGADIDFADKRSGSTALVEAAIAGHAECVHLLLARGADLDFTDCTLGHTALGWAALQGHAGVVEKLIAAGAQVDRTESKFHFTPLMNASGAGHAGIVEALLSAGADPHAPTCDGRNALSMAEAGRHFEVAELLKRHGAQAPQPLQLVRLPWPEVAADLSGVDDADPASVLRGFILAMNRWELDCEQKRRNSVSGDVDWPTVIQGQDEVFKRFCVLKPRPYGRGGSFSSLPEYTADECLSAIEMEGSRALLTTLKTSSGGVLHDECQYALSRKGGAWRVDHKKRRSLGTTEWRRDTL